MSFKIEMLPDEPIVVITLGEDFNVEADTPAISRQYIELVEAASQPVYLIIDFRPARKALSVASIIAGANLSAKGEVPFFNHPLNKEVIWVATSEVMKMAAKGLNTDIFGKLKVSVFETLEEALSYARSQQ